VEAWVIVCVLFVFGALIEYAGETIFANICIYINEVHLFLLLSYVTKRSFAQNEIGCVKSDKAEKD
jgi:hypothetical protein